MIPISKPIHDLLSKKLDEISWNKAFELMDERLGNLRASDPKQFALFTDRDQMQALTGMFARQFGTPNYAAHGGFCSVNMAAGMIYTIGGSFWQFGGPATNATVLPFAALQIQYFGLLAERWFFFAQANHPHNLYYQTV